MGFSNLELNNRIDVLYAEKNTCYKMIIDMIKMYEDMSVEYEHFNEKIGNLENELSSKDEEIVRLYDNLRSIKNKLNNTNEHNEELSTKLENSNKELDKKSNELDRALENIADLEDKLNAEIDNSSNEIRSLNEKNKEYLRNIEELHGVIDELHEVIDELKDKISEYENDRESLNDIKIELNSTIADRDKLSEGAESISVRLSEYEEKNRNLEEEYNKIKNRYNEAINRCKRYEGKMEEIHKGYDSKTEELNKELSKYIESNKRLKESGVAGLYERNLSKVDGLNIISVIGQSGSGVTTVSVSIMKWLAKRKNNVCYLDLDLVYSDAESFLRKNPIVSDNMSSLEMYNCGKWNNNCIIDCKFGGYISGVVNNRLFSITSCDFRELLKKVKDSGYDYLVVDLGKIGVSENNDELIKDFCSVSSTVIGVGTNDKFRFRRFIMDLKRCDISCKLILNKCKTTIIDEYIKGITKDYYVMPFSDDVQQSNESFYSDEMTEIKFNRMMGDIYNGRV